MKINPNIVETMKQTEHRKSFVISERRANASLFSEPVKPTSI